MELRLTQKTGGYVVPVSKIRLHTSLKSAGILEWETPCRDIAPQNGDTVNFGEVFQGYVFRSEDDGRVKRTVCYDQIKYLLYRDTKEFTGKTAADILREIIRERELTAGEIADTGVVIPSYLCENQTLLSMVQGALEETEKVSGKEFVFFDRCGALCLLDAAAMETQTALDGSAQMTGFSKSSDIEETFTRFKLLQEDKRSGFRRVMEAENGGDREKWGVLQYFERVDHSWNQAQVQARLQALQDSYGKERQALEVKGVGDFSCLAGRAVFCRLPEEDAARRYLIEESVITGQGDVFRMTLKLREV